MVSLSVKESESNVQVSSTSYQSHFISQRLNSVLARGLVSKGGIRGDSGRLYRVTCVDVTFLVDWDISWNGSFQQCVRGWAFCHS